MLDIDHIASQVKQNCNISDARYWGLYSPCGLLLRLRDLYKAEKGLRPWDKVRHEEIGEWIGERERLWMKIGSCDFQRIEVKGKKYRPFDVKGINSVLLKEGYLYGAGYGNLLKPSFMLSELSMESSSGRYKIYISGRELSRDLSTSPAMLQRDTIIARHDAMRFFLWGKFEEMTERKHDSILSHAFREYGLSKGKGMARNILSSEEFEELFERVTRDELEAYIHHELGEASQRRLLGKWWRSILLNLPYSRAELFMRAIKDILSDTCNAGMLTYIIKNKKTGSLAFYVALLSGYRKGIFPYIITAYDEFMNTGDWTLIERARVEGYKRVRYYIEILKEYFNNGRISREVIEDELMSKII